MADEIGPLAFLRALFRGPAGESRVDDDRYPPRPRQEAPRDNDRVEPVRRSVTEVTRRERRPRPLAPTPSTRRANPGGPGPAAEPVQLVQRPASRALAEQARRAATHADGDMQYAPPVPSPAPRRDEIPSAVPLSAPIEAAIDLSPFARDPVLQLDPGAVLGAIRSGDVNATLVSPAGGQIDRLRVAAGTQLPGQVTIRDGVVTGAQVNVTDGQGRPSALGGPVNVRGVSLTADRRVLVHMERGFTAFFASLFGMNNQTSSIFRGEQRVPTDPRRFFQALGFGEEIPLLGPRSERPPSAQLTEIRRVIDLQRSPVSASVELATSSTLVPFGRGLEVAFAPGSRATFTRANGLDTIVIDANVTRARFGVQDGPNLTTGEANLRITARELVENGVKRWVVTAAPNGRITGAVLRTPVNDGQGRVNELNLGNVTLTNAGQPIVTLADGKLTVGFDTRLDNITGQLHLNDSSNRRGLLTLGTGRNPREALRVQARVDMVTSAEHPTQVDSLRISADTDGLNLGLAAPQGVQLAKGEGFSFGVQNGTSLAGNGRITYTMGRTVPTNFTLESQNGVQAEVRLFGARVNRSLGEIGIRANLQDGALSQARVRSFDWASGGLDMSAQLKATLDRATVRLPSQEQASVSNATATGHADITFTPGDASPQVRGTLNIEVSATGNGTPTARPALSFLPRNVPGFDRANAEAGVQAQLTDGKLVATLPFTIGRDGSVVTRNEADSGARLRFERLAVDTLFNTAGARAAGLNRNLPMYTDVQQAEARHRELERSLAIRPIPALDPNASPDPRAAVDDVARRLDPAALISGALQEADIDLTVRTQREHRVTVAQGLVGDVGTKVLVIPQGTMRLVVESDGSRVTPQLATRPDGSPNPTAFEPSGLTFDPPLRVVFNPSDNGRWWNGLSESTLEIHGFDIVRSPSNPQEIVMRPRLGRASFGDASFLKGVQRASEGLGLGDTLDRFITGQVMELATGASDIPTTTQELAARVARHAHVQIDTHADIVERATRNLAPAAKAYVIETLQHTELLARAKILPGESIRFGQDAIRIAAADDIRVVRNSGRTEVTGMVTFGEGSVTAANGSSVSLRGVSARLRMVQGGGPANPGGSTMELTDIVAPELTFTQSDRQNYSIRNGRARRIVVANGGRVTVEGLSGELSGNLLYNGSQVWVQSSRLTNGSMQMDASGAIRTGPLALENLVATATNIGVPPESDDPAASGVSAQIKRLDLRAETATLSATPEAGISLTMPPNNRARVMVDTDATFVFPSPRMHVQVRNAHSTGFLESLQIGSTAKHIKLHDWYLETDATSGQVSGTIVAGPTGSQAANLQILPEWTDSANQARRARLRIYVGSLGFTQQGRDQRVDALMSGRIDAMFRLPDRAGPLPPEARQSRTSVRGTGQFGGSVDFSTRSQGRPITPGVTSKDAPSDLAAQAHFELSDGDLSADIAVSGPDAIAGARITSEAIRRRWNERGPAAQPTETPRGAPVMPRVPTPDPDMGERARRERAAAQAVERQRRRTQERNGIP